MRSTATPPKRGGSSSNRAQPRPAAGERRARTGARPASSGRPGGASRTPDPAVFRRRRLVALTILLVLVLAVAIGVRAAVRAVAAADDTLPRDLSSTPIERTGADVKPTGPPTEEELANPVDCRPSAVDLTIDLGKETDAGATTAMPVTVTNTGQVPCLLDVGGAAVQLAIYSGDDLVWTSEHCSTRGDRRVLLDIGAEETISFRWPGTRSAEGCPDEQPVADTGTYRAVVTLTTAGDVGKDAPTIERVFTVA